MCTGTVPATGAEALAMLESALGFLAAEDATGISTEAVADRLRVLERADAVGAAVRGGLLRAFDAQDGPVGDGQRTIRSWLAQEIPTLSDETREIAARVAGRVRFGKPAKLRCACRRRRSWTQLSRPMISPAG